MAGDWAINKCRHMTFGQRFIWITDSYAVRFLLTYDGNNPAVLRLQMRLMCWDMDIEHRNAHHLMDADYWSRLGVDLCYDPLLKDYIQQAQSLRKANPPPLALPMQPENMPYWRAKRGPTLRDSCPTAPDVRAHAIVATIIAGNSNGVQHLANWPVHIGHSPTATNLNARALYNDDIPLAARMLARFDSVIYGFNSGHFQNSIAAKNLAFNIVLASDPYAHNRALFKEFTKCPTILSGAKELLDHIRGSDERSQIHGYYAHSHRYASSEPTRKFWAMQHAIITQLRTIRNLQIFAAVVHPDNDRKATATFITKCRSTGWIISRTELAFPDYGDSIDGSTYVIIGVHETTDTTVAPLQLKTPPSLPSQPLADYIYPKFNDRRFVLAFSRDDDLFNKADDMPQLIVTEPKRAHTRDTSATCDILYHLHRDGADTSNLAGSHVFNLAGLCPTFESCPNSNLFRNYFGIQFNKDDHSYVRGISPFEYASAFRFGPDLTYRLSHPTHMHALDAGIPALTSTWLSHQLQERLMEIRDANCEIYDQSHYAAPAAHIQAFLNGAIGTRLPTSEAWIRAYANDPDLKLIHEFVLNPSKITNNANLQKVDYNYRQPLRQGRIFLENNLLILREPIRGYESYTRLQLVPKDIRNIVFIAFHTNPIGGHFNPYRTLHRIRLRFYWPKMWSYVQKMCKSCPGCSLANRTHRPSSELVYGFPVEAPMLVLHVDGYSAGKHSGFEGSESYLIAACGMCTFAAMEPIHKADSTAFASAIMKIQLRYGFCHTIVLDKDSKFFGVCRQAIDLLQINCHVLSGGNHNPMIVERINRFLNKGLKIFTNERNSVRVALEAILLLLYAWNSCPVPGTDISRSMVCVGREFSFPIDFSTGKHWELTSSVTTVSSYARDLAERLSACHEIAELLVQEQRAYHQEYHNSRRQDPRLYKVGDIVWAERSVKSDKRRGQVGNLSYRFTGPWQITAKLDGGSYALKHCHSDRLDKKTAPALYPYPENLIPFQPVDGADNRYGQLYKPIGKTPYSEAGIKGFEPPQPFKAHAAFSSAGKVSDFHFPSLSELIEDLTPFPWRNEEEKLAYYDGDELETYPVLTYDGPPPQPPTYPPASIPTLPSLVASIIASKDKLFFISHTYTDDTHREWRLVGIAFEDSMAFYPSCLQDGRFLVEFYILHNADIRYNGINQRYWLQYHNASELTTPTTTTDTHLIRPSDTSEAYATRHKLVAFRQWVNLTHEAVFIHGPFDFATVKGRHSRDRVAEDDWTALRAHQDMFTNALPRHDLPTYSIHVDRGTHITFCNADITTQLTASAMTARTEPLYR